MKINMKDLYIDLQKKLLADLEIGQNIKHPTTKGDATEIDWLTMLDRHLPKRYHVKKAFVVDADGNLSDQIDVVIFDRQYCPLLFEHNGATYVPAESVYAGFEVKQTLNKEFIEYAGEKIESIRELRRTSVNIHYAAGVYPPKKPFKIIGGILSLDSDWNPGLGEPLRKAIFNLAEPQHLDLGCSLRCGSFDVEYLNDQLSKLEIGNQETALVYLIMHLIDRLQRLGTVPAIDLHEYTKNL